MPKWKLQNYTTCCFKRFANVIDYVNHDQYFRHLNNMTYMQYNAVAIPVRSFQRNQQAVYTVYCTGPTRQRTHKLPRNYIVLPWMGTSWNSYFKSTSTCIPAQLKCLFIVVDTELTVKVLLFSVETFATGPIYQTAGMVMLQERLQPPIQPWRDGWYCCKPCFSVKISSIILISTI